MSYKTIKLSPETHELLKDIAAEDTSTIQQVVTNFVNAAVNRVNHALKTGTIPAQKDGEDWTEVVPSSYHRLFCALHFKELGVISEEQFQKNKHDLGGLVFVRGLEKIELTSKLSTMSPEERKVWELETKLRRAKAALKAKKS